MNNNTGGPPPADAKPAAVTSGMKRPAAASEKQAELSEKKLRRLEKNRLSARECRRRKREATENLEREINVLEGENLRLRLQLQVRVLLVAVARNKLAFFISPCTHPYYHIQHYRLEKKQKIP